MPGWHGRALLDGDWQRVPSWVARAAATWLNASSVVSPPGSLPRCLLLSGCSLGSRLYGCLVAPAPGALDKKVNQRVCAPGGGGPCPLLIRSVWSRPPFLLWPWRADFAELTWVRLRWLLSSPGSDAARAHASLLRDRSAGTPSTSRALLVDPPACLAVYTRDFLRLRTIDPWCPRGPRLCGFHVPRREGFLPEGANTGPHLFPQLRVYPGSLYSIHLPTNCLCFRH